MSCILAIDQGTTSSRALVFDRKGKILGAAFKEFRQVFPKPGWVEHDPMDIWNSQLRVIHDALRDAAVPASGLAAIGITNQRETALAWDRETGKPLCHAIVWQDRRTSGYCEEMKGRGLEPLIQEKTGLVIDAYFSASKWKWILDHVPAAREKAARGALMLGTVDTWLVWKLTGGEAHVTDVTNACRTMLFNIHSLTWDQDLLDLFGIRKEWLPEVRSSSEIIGKTESGMFSRRIPISGMAGDQQAATFGQGCLEPGTVKCTYGTGCFILCNTGEKPVGTKSNMLTTVAWQRAGETTYSLEGSIFMGGAVVQWLRDGLGIIGTSGEVEELASSVSDSGGVYFVPAFTGLGAPHWDPWARGLIGGLTRGVTSGHLARAALESIAFQVRDVTEAMEKDAGLRFSELKVDGGAAVNDLLLQFQADLLGIPVVRPSTIETTALGAAYLAGLGTGFWKDTSEIRDQWEPDRVFRPGIGEQERNRLRKGWDHAVSRARGWVPG